MDVQFQIGDIVTTPDHGNGIIISREHFDKAGEPVVETENPLSECVGTVRFGVTLEFKPSNDFPDPAYYWPAQLKHLQQG